MKNNGLIIVLAFFVLLPICSCAPIGSDNYLYRLIAYNLPYTMGNEGGEWADTTIIEKDDYGRILFKYERGNFSDIVYDELCIYAICQKRKGNIVYAYEDCFFVMRQSDNVLSERDILLLKEYNDWNLPLNEDKMSTTDIRGKKHKESKEIELASNIFRDYIKCTEEDVIDICMVDVDDSGYRTLYAICFIKEAMEYDKKKSDLPIYFMLLDTEHEGENYNYIIELVESIYEYQNQLHGLKIMIGWDF